jgi:hypothetical protein
MKSTAFFVDVNLTLILSAIFAAAAELYYGANGRRLMSDCVRL